MPREVFRHIMILAGIEMHELEGERFNERGERRVDGGVGSKVDVGAGGVFRMAAEIREYLEEDFWREGEERG